VTSVIPLSTAARNVALWTEQLSFGLLLAGRLHELLVGGADEGVGVGAGPGAVEGVGVGAGAGPPSTGVGVGCGITTGMVTGDCEGAGLGSDGFVGSASWSA
jgi:hypothetical protein